MFFHLSPLKPWRHSTGAQSVMPRLLKEVTDTRGSHTHEHLNKVRAAPVHAQGQFLVLRELKKRVQSGKSADC